MMVDRSFATREHAMLRRVEVGLMDEAVRVVRAVPDDVEDPGRSSLAPTVLYHDANWRFINKAHAKRLLREVQLIEPSLAGESESDLLDVVHAWGDACWDMAIDMAADTGAALAIELWSHASTKRIRTIERRAAARAETIRGMWLAPNERLRAAAEEQKPTWPVRAAHWGIYADEHDPHRRRPGAPIGISIVCSGRDEAAIKPVLDALAACVRLEENILIFLDDAAVESQPGVWKHAERLGMLDHLSIIADMESRRELVLETDVLVLPDALGEVRSIVLDAMASGVAVVAQADPYIEVTAKPGLAIVVDAPTEQSWLEALRRVTSDPDETARIGTRARERVIAERPAHRQVDAILAAYRELTDNPSIAFPG